MNDTPRGSQRVGLLWQNHPGSADNSNRSPERFAPLVEAFRALDVAAVPVLYSAATIQEVRRQLLGFDGVVVWINPIEGGANRAPLDALLRDIASQGVWVSTHPDVILKMGTKEVLFWTRSLGWGSDVDLYRSNDELITRFGVRLSKERVRVLKQGRGNGGHGVWKVELLDSPTDGGQLTPGSMLRVQHAARDAVVEHIRFAEFIERCEEYFAWAGFVIDQPFQERLADGMIRCYLVQDKVVGFCHQWPQGLLPSQHGADEAHERSSEMEGPEAPNFQGLKLRMQSDWSPKLQEILALEATSLPVIWDADFFYGPKTAAGEDSYVLCEINVSAVWPFPPQATKSVAAAATACILANRTSRPGRARF